MQNTGFRAFLPVIISVSVVIGLFIGYYLPGRNSGTAGQNLSGYNKLAVALSYIRRSYVDTIGLSRLQDSALTGILHELDPHSDYIPAADYASVIEPLESGFEGIGIQFRMVSDSVYILDVIPAGPAEEAGLKIGDRIVFVNSDTISGKKYSTGEVVSRLKGVKGSSEKVGIRRRGLSTVLKLTVTRNRIPTTSIDLAFMPRPGTGYIKLEKFAENSGDDFSQALKTLIGKGMQNLIIDLRGNTGGVMSSAVQIAGEFLPEKQMIVYTLGANRSKTTFNTEVDGSFKTGKVCVLIDEESASASEIVAGALQDNDRATIIGRRSYGKGLVQEQLNFKDNSAIRLTVARYYTPSGRCIQKPFGTDRSDYYAEATERYYTGELTANDSTFKDTRPVYKTRNGRKVYGGGGITPDVVVKPATGPEWVYLNMLIEMNIIPNSAFDYADSRRTTLLKMYPDFEKFRNEFRISAQELKLIEGKLESLSGVSNKEVLQKIETYISNQYKYFVAQYLYGYGAYYEISLATDRIYQKALEEGL